MTSTNARDLFAEAVADSVSGTSVEKLRKKYQTQVRLYGEAESKVERTRRSWEAAKADRDARKKTLNAVALELKIAAEAAGVDPLGDIDDEGAGELDSARSEGGAASSASLSASSGPSADTNAPQAYSGGASTGTDASAAGTAGPGAQQPWGRDDGGAQ